MPLKRDDVDRARTERTFLTHSQFVERRELPSLLLMSTPADSSSTQVHGHKNVWRFLYFKFMLTFLT